MKLWIDDVRPAPDGWTLAQTSKDAILAICTALDNDDHEFEISFDHDLGGDDTTIPVVNYLEEQIVNGLRLHRFNWHIHSANPVGRVNLNLALTSIERFNKM